MRGGCRYIDWFLQGTFEPEHAKSEAENGWGGREDQQQDSLHPMHSPLPGTA
jgi:hypothetical protein